MKIMPIIIAILIVVFIIVAIKRKIKLPESRGDAGESKVAKILGETVPGEQYVINDLLFTDKSGHSCQIDHIYINKYGIWVIETKNYSGMIYGNENQRTWTQVLRTATKKTLFIIP